MNKIIELDKKYNLIDKIKNQITYIQEYPKMSELKMKLCKIEKAEKMYTKQLQLLKQSIISLENNLKDKENELKKVDEDLYSGLIKDIKLLENIKNKEMNLQKSKEQIEQELIENMDIVEDLNIKIQKCKTKCNELKQIIKNLNQKISEKIDEYTKNLHTNLDQIESLRSEINNENLIKYDTIRKKYKNALVKVDNNICGGCNVELFMNKISKLDNNQIIECENCGRLMYK
ncbi:zinc ribbon domain-containing protein [Tepidibacter aestuarii]|uniref:zinc ribbon domain-containing protein n=1 Tax=Tepidibacter aestuarii TaxID=2925782 RepID=UPI0020C138C5|nr:hypothetical protein [Tepidibacter aestuarii]CAH2213684.1 Predicted nucleic acid-binding protein, contains Zn-ribbon domain [Tepidibacter aestuarii]